MEEDTPTAKSVPVQTPPPRVVNAWAKGPPSNLTKTNEIDETKEDIKTNISSDPSDTFSQPSDSTTNENELDELIIETKLLEYFEDADPELGVSNFKDILESGVKAEQLVVTSLNLTIEKKDKHRKMLSDLFVQLLTQKVFSSEDVIDGFRKCSEFFEDWQVDVPRLPEFVRSWINPLIEQDLCKQNDFSFLPDRFILNPLETRI